MHTCTKVPCALDMLPVKNIVVRTKLKKFIMQHFSFEGCFHLTFAWTHASVKTNLPFSTASDRIESVIDLLPFACRGSALFFSLFTNEPSRDSARS
jgi:hypothetical protein